MALRNETHIIGQQRIREAADHLVDSVLHLAKNGVPEPDEVRQIRASVDAHIKELITAVRDHLAQTTSRALPPTFSPAELARNLGITQEKVLNWIHEGKLDAIDVSQDQQGRPRYRIDADAIARFKATRNPAPPPKVERRKKRSMEGVIEFF